jgi:defect-in-organelle-trafficking protein DotB
LARAAAIDNLQSEIGVSHTTLITATVRKLVRDKGRTMEVDAREKFEAGIISERNYHLIAEQAKREDKDAGLV